MAYSKDYLLLATKVLDEVSKNKNTNRGFESDQPHDASSSLIGFTCIKCEKMEKKKEQNQEESLTDAYSLFVYAIRTKIIRDYVYIVRSIIPSDVIDDHLKIYCERIEQLRGT